jgi:hypothetical protein
MPGRSRRAMPVPQARVELRLDEVLDAEPRSV